MPTNVTCPKCSTLLAIPDSPAGPMACPKCATAISTPASLPVIQTSGSRPPGAVSMAKPKPQTSSALSTALLVIGGVAMLGGGGVAMWNFNEILEMNRTIQSIRNDPTMKQFGDFVEAPGIRDVPYNWIVTGGIVAAVGLVCLLVGLLIRPRARRFKRY